MGLFVTGVWGFGTGLGRPVYDDLRYEGWNVVFGHLGVGEQASEF